MNRRIFLPLLLAVSLAACKDGATVVTNGLVKAVREGNGVRLTNMTDEARAYAINDPDWLAVASLDLIAACSTTDVACLRLPANASVFVPFTEVGGYSASSKEVQVWTWRVLPNGAGGSLQPVMDDAITLKL
jgi:hypothetical protein